MENFQIISQSKEYKKLLEELKELEKDRIYCRHNIEHFLDVARIMYIYVLEDRLDYSKDLVYTTALLHDIGRVLQYKEGLDHDIASHNIAKDLLELTDFSKEDKELILDTILKHREASEGEFQRLFYRADKESRLCFNCPARSTCKWPEERKNMVIKI